MKDILEIFFYILGLIVCVSAMIVFATLYTIQFIIAVAICIIIVAILFILVRIKIL